MGFPEQRPRRLRRTAAVRRLVAETLLSVDDLVAPLFVKEGIDEPQPIPSMPGVVQHTQESLRKEVRALADLGIPGIILFGVPAQKDGRGSGGDDPGGVVQVALRNLRDEVGDRLVLMADNCLDEYTDHGHCGILTDTGEVDNDATLVRYASIAVAQAEAGVDVVAPSGMMDGQVAAIRAALDGSGHSDVAILAYAAKYASALYGPFRDAAECAPKFGDRRAYQMDAGNGRVHAYLAAHAEVYRQEYHDNRVLLRCYLPKHLVYHIQEPDVHIRVLRNGAHEPAKEEEE